jgi:transcriptional regulator with XRE-family HTH domain
MSRLVDAAVARAFGVEIRRARTDRGWSRRAVVARLPSGIVDRTLLSYEDGIRMITVVRLVELCHGLGIDMPSLARRALQRANIHLEDLGLHVDLRMLLKDRSEAYRPMRQWARNTLNAHPGGVVEVVPAAVQNLAMFVGVSHSDLAKYLARFSPDAGVPVLGM